MYPIRVEYNELMEEFICCTRKDVRFVGLNNGKTKVNYYFNICFFFFLQKIYGALIEYLDDEITIFKTIEQNKKFVVGNHRG